MSADLAGTRLLARGADRSGEGLRVMHTVQKLLGSGGLLILGALVFVSFDPNGLLSGYTTLPIQIFNWTGRPQEEFHVLAAAASILLLGLLLAMNAIAIVIRNRYQKRW